MPVLEKFDKSWKTKQAWKQEASYIVLNCKWNRIHVVHLYAITGLFVLCKNSDLVDFYNKDPS